MLRPVDETEFRRILAARMKETRLRCFPNQTPAEFARLIKMQRSQIIRWEAGVSLPRLPQLMRYARLCNTTAADLLGGFGRRPVAEQLPLPLDLDPRARAVVVHLVNLLRERPIARKRAAQRGR